MHHIKKKPWTITNKVLYDEQTTQEQICSPVNTFYVMYSNAEKPTFRTQRLVFRFFKLYMIYTGS